ncbi:hypothetical protein [Sulfurimonas sp.]
MNNNISVCLERNFIELKKLSKEQLEDEVLKTLNSVGYDPVKIEFGKPNRGTMGEIRVPVLFDEKKAMCNWSNKQDKKVIGGKDAF